MDEQELAESLRRVREGSLDRRQFARTLLGLGLTAPMVVELLGPRPGHAQARRPVFTPSRRGGGGELKTLWWQAPTILNPHLATGAKDADASRIFYEGLVSFDPDGNFVPDLAAEIPTLENGGVAGDGLSVIVKLKKGVQWHDGKPFTADDVVFTWEYVIDPATAATTTGAYRDIARIDKLDQHTVKIVYKSPNPFWAKAFGSIIPRHAFAPVKGEKSREATANLQPVGTDPAVRTALSLLVDRASIQEQIYGRHGQATANYLNAPPTFRSKNTRWEFNPEKAAKVLDDAGWKRAGDGLRAKDGRRLRMLFQTSINAPRQKTQAIVKQAAAKVGIELEVKAVVPAVYFSTDPANADTLAHFSADLQMYSLVNGSPDPQLFMQPFVSWEIAQKDNKWAGRNSTLWRNDEYDRMYKAAETEMDPVKRATLFIRMNDMLVQNVVIVPFLWRGTASAVSNKLRGTDISGWDLTFWNLAHWYREP